MKLLWKVAVFCVPVVLVFSFVHPVKAKIENPLAKTDRAAGSSVIDADIAPEDCVSGRAYLVASAHDRCSFPGLWGYRARNSSENFNLPDEGEVDLNVTYITQTPRYEYSNPVKNHHLPGDPVTFVAHVANHGLLESGDYSYQWLVDEVVVEDGNAASLASSEYITFEYTWVWKSGNHTVGFIVDSNNLIDEISEVNNQVVDRANALAVGFWVEQSVYDWFNENQVNLGLGSVSWEDWAQRQLKYWNQMFEEAVSPLTPDGIVERVRLDKVVIIPDGTWGDCVNWPTPEDQTVDLVWGFPSEIVGVATGRVCPPLNFYINNPQFQIFEPPLLHEMSHARYLVDLYGLNHFVNAAYLVAGVSTTSTTLVTDRNVENDTWPLPAYLAVGGEMIVCQSKNGNTFANCARGVQGTIPRSHSTNTPVHLATVRLQDGNGNLVQGSPALPVVGDWDDHLYYNRYPDDLMSGGLGYYQHSAFAWNRIVGQRPICGNYNASCNIGEYVNDIPQSNIIEVFSPANLPVGGIKVEVFQGKPFPLWYGKYFDGPAAIVGYTDTNGRVNLGKFPFDNERDEIVHTWGHSNALILVRFSSGGDTEYRFFEVTQANEAYWMGQTEVAVYRFTVPFEGSVPTYTAYLSSIVSEGDAEQPQIPQFVYPLEGQTLDFDGDYLFKVQEMPQSDGFLWGFFQNGQMIWENLRDEGTLSSNVYAILNGTEAHNRFSRGAVEVWVRAAIHGQWTDATVITIYLE